jgi:hypothetical protein
MRYPNLTHTLIQRAYPRTVRCRRKAYRLRTVASYLRETSSKAQGPACPDLTVGLQALSHHIPLGLVLPEVPEELFLIRVILANPLQASLYPTSTYLSSRARPL